MALVKSSIDTRYHSARIVTHDGHSKVCLRQRPMSLMAGCTPDAIAIVSLVGIDLQVMTCGKPRHRKLGKTERYMIHSST